MKNHIAKTLVMKFSNKFTKQLVLTMRVPYLPFRATVGYYSRLYKRIKEIAHFSDCEKNLIVGKKYFETSKTERSIIELPSGVKLDYPYDVNERDVAIIKHNLQGVQMSFSK